MKKILVVEDDLSLCRLLQQHLEQDVFTQLYFANDFLEALNQTLHHDFDLFLVDINLENSNGLDLIKKLSSNKSLANRVIVMSSQLDREKLIKGYDLGVSNFIEKPLDFELLRAMLRKNIAMLDKKSLSEFHFENLWIYPLSYSAVIKLENKEVELNLSPTEFHLLSSLVLLKGRVAEKEELTYSTRDQNLNMSVKSLEVHISSLRKKLSLYPCPRIETKWGIGYFLKKAQNKEEAS